MEQVGSCRGGEERLRELASPGAAVPSGEPYQPFSRFAAALRQSVPGHVSGDKGRPEARGRRRGSVGGSSCSGGGLSRSDSHGLHGDLHGEARMISGAEQVERVLRLAAARLSSNQSTVELLRTDPEGTSTPGGTTTLVDELVETWQQLGPTCADGRDARRNCSTASALRWTRSCRPPLLPESPSKGALRLVPTRAPSWAGFGTPPVGAKPSRGMLGNLRWRRPGPPKPLLVHPEGGPGWRPTMGSSARMRSASKRGALPSSAGPGGDTFPRNRFFFPASSLPLVPHWDVLLQGFPCPPKPMLMSPVCVLCHMDSQGRDGFPFLLSLKAPAVATACYVRLLRGLMPCRTARHCPLPERC
eukprot:jgi/Botrbrau1/22692/Bobra.0132s0033.1